MVMEKSTMTIERLIYGKSWFFMVSRNGVYKRIRDPLPLPSASVYTTLELHKLIHQGYIDLNPPYQRGALYYHIPARWVAPDLSKDPVWSIERQTVLIESIYRNYYIPPILFLVTENDPTSDTPLRVCMDGKQRLTSIQAFFDGQVRFLAHYYPVSPFNIDHLDSLYVCIKQFVRYHLNFFKRPRSCVEEKILLHCPAVTG